MVKVKLSTQEIELVRVSTLRWMLARGLSAEEVAHRMPGTRADSVRKFLIGRRLSQHIAAELVRRFPLDLVYSPPSVSPSPAVAAETAACTVSSSR